VPFREPEANTGSFRMTGYSSTVRVMEELPTTHEVT
jgi:hypothetical protein